MTSSKPTYEELEQRVQALEEALRERDSLLDHLPDHAIIQDLDHRILWANRVAAESVGEEIEDLVGRPCYEIWQQRDVPCEDCPVLEAMKTGQPQEREADTPDGQVYRIRGYPVYDENQRLIGAVEYGLDITDGKRTEEALRQHETLFRAVFEQAPCAVLLIDAQTGEAVEFNEQAHRALGYSREEFKALSLADIEIEESPEEIERHMKNLLRQGEDTFETRHRAKDGHIVDVIVSSRAISLQGKAFFVSLWTDITERKQAEEILEVQHAKLQSLFEYSGEAIVLLDRDNRIQDANQAFVDLFGYGWEEARGRRIQGLICPARFFRESRDLDEQSLTGIKGAEIIRRRKDGREIHVRASAGPIKVHGEVIGRFVVFDDITKRKRTEERMAIMVEMLDAAPGSITVHDTEGRFLYANRRTFELHGYDEREFMVINLHDLDVPESEALLEERFRRIAEQGEATFEVRHYRKDGTEFPLTVVAKSIQWHGKPAVLSIATDITQRKQAEEEKKKLEAQLHQSQKMEAIGTLAGGIAHDFNNILGIIVGNAELALFDLPEWSPSRESLREIREASLRARDLVTQILLFARQKEHVISTLRVEPIAKESLKMLRASIPATVDIRTEIEEGLPSILADPGQIQQIILNLCTNACQVMETEGGILAFALTSADLDAPLDTLCGVLPEGRYVHLQVADTGPGISPEHLDRVFEPFFTTKGVGEGTGLGLAVVHGILQDRNGGITVESEPGKGTCFTVYLPAAEEMPDEKGVKSSSEMASGTECILFVDDEPMIRKLGKRLLEHQGYEVETRKSGAEALERFKEDVNLFDLVVTDMTMPGMWGDQLARHLMELRPDVPVILATGYSKQISEEEAREIGIRALVMKPLTAKELGKVVREVLDR